MADSISNLSVVHDIVPLHNVDAGFGKVEEIVAFWDEEDRLARRKQTE